MAILVSVLLKVLIGKLVGAGRFELPTPGPPDSNSRCCIPLPFNYLDHSSFFASGLKVSKVARIEHPSRIFAAPADLDIAEVPVLDVAE